MGETAGEEVFLADKIVDSGFGQVMCCCTSGAPSYFRFFKVIFSDHLWHGMTTWPQYHPCNGYVVPKQNIRLTPLLAPTTNYKPAKVCLCLRLHCPLATSKPSGFGKYIGSYRCWLEAATLHSFHHSIFHARRKGRCLTLSEIGFLWGLHTLLPGSPVEEFSRQKIESPIQSSSKKGL